MRKLAGVIVVAAVALGVLVGSGSLASAAVDDASCSFSVATAAAGKVDITGVAPPSVYVKAFVNGNPAGIKQADGVGNFSFPGVTGLVTDTITVSYGLSPDAAYPAASCIRTAGEIVVRPEVGPAAAAAAASLAFTGSSGTPSMTLIGVGALLVGVVLVVAARRRHRAPVA